jgi:hypothetical protein
LQALAIAASHASETQITSAYHVLPIDKSGV